MPRGSYFKTQSTPERFWSKVQQSDGCWEWQGGKASMRYGRFRYHTSTGEVLHVPAHRFAWTLAYGSIPDGMYVCHKCDNPPCVRPDHLFLGTPGDNVRDMVTKHREPNGCAMTRDKRYARRAAMIDMRQAGMSAISIATQFKLSRQRVHDILTTHGPGHWPHPWMGQPSERVCDCHSRCCVEARRNKRQDA